MTATEVLGFVTGAVSVWLAVRENVWNWPVGIINSATFLVLFWSASLYANASLQIIYVALAVFGWWNWLRGGRAQGQLKVQRTPRSQMFMLAVLTAVGAIVLTEILDRSTDSTVSVWDGLTVALSLTATYMLSRKLLENWLVWIVADLIYVPLYASQQLYLTSMVYFLFLVMCIVGFRRWQRTAS